MENKYTFYIEKSDYVDREGRDIKLWAKHKSESHANPAFNVEEMRDLYNTVGEYLNENDENDKSIKFGSYLDAKDARRKALEALRDKCFSLLSDWFDWLCADYPKHQKERKEKLGEIRMQMICRMQDYNVFMWDFEKDWDLNYQDYGLDKVYEQD